MNAPARQLARSSTATLPVALLLLVQCGPWTPDQIQVRDSCPGPLGSTIFVEQGALTTCGQAQTDLDDKTSLYSRSWGVPNLDGWALRVRQDYIVDTQGGLHAGVTFYEYRIVDIRDARPFTLPHELHHVALGPSSSHHDGWCPGFFDWEKGAVGVDETAYYDCTVH